jgi:hypothetical protein
MRVILHKRDVNRVIAPILARGKQAEAARVFEDVRAMIGWATAEGHLDFSPVERSEFQTAANAS